MAELEAINLYEQMASMAGNELIRQALLEIAREEKTHVGEFLSLLTEIDREQAEELKKGEAEVRELREKLSS
ncbi:rubrerythrin [Candidatus Bathyarchaeota archaeon ex4484_135]|nr:MAG: rubrerythrin [Candidatus Bathyarchaeota archaeon ex4484_135]